MTTLQEIEDRIEQLSRLEIGAPSTDGYDERIYASDASEACARLSETWRELRTILWSGPFQGWARELETKCQASLERISEEHGLLYGGRPARFPAYPGSNGTIHPAID